MLDLAKEFGFKVAAFHHGVEAYKLADRLAAEGVCGALWADWWGFKMEAFDGIQENIALVDRPANSCAIVHSDSDEGIQRLNQEAAKVIAHAKLAGMDIAPERAIRWLTQNPAKALGILDADRHAGGRQDGRRGAVERQSRSACTRRPSRSTSTARACTTATMRRGSRHPTSCSARACAEVRCEPPRSEVAGRAGAGVRRVRRARRAQDVLIRNATVHTAGAQGTLQNADVLVAAARCAPSAWAWWHRPTRR